MKSVSLIALVGMAVLSGCASNYNSVYNNIMSQTMQKMSNESPGTLDTTLVFSDPVLQRFYGQYQSDFPKFGQINWDVPPAAGKWGCSPASLEQVKGQATAANEQARRGVKTTLNDAHVTSAQGTCTNGQFTGEATVYYDKTVAVAGTAVQIKAYTTLHFKNNKQVEAELQTIFFHTDTSTVLKVGDGAVHLKNNSIIYKQGDDTVTFAPNKPSVLVAETRRVLSVSHSKIVKKNPRSTWTRGYENNVQSTLTQDVENGGTHAITYLQPVTWPANQYENLSTYGRTVVDNQDYYLKQTCTNETGSYKCVSGAVNSGTQTAGTQSSTGAVLGLQLAQGVTGTPARVAPAGASGAQTGTQVEPIQGNSGRYMSPFLSNGVLANWVSKFDTAGSVGGTVGSAVTSHFTNKALGYVPFGLGGLVANKVGQKAGSAIGQHTVLTEAAAREASDLSFNDLNDMARWLARTHRSNPQIQHAMEVAAKLYPGLNEAYLAALNQ